MMKDMKTKTLTKIGILGAVSFILMMIEFPLPFAPAFYKLDFSEVAVLMGGFALGPAAAVWIEALKVALNLLFQGSITAGVGEIANFLIGISFVVPASMIYAKHKTKKNAMKGLIHGTIWMAVMGFVLNYFVLLPAYSYFLKMPIEALVGMGAAIIPAIDTKFKFVLLATTPFNLFKGIVVSVVTLYLYKHISPLLHR